MSNETFQHEALYHQFAQVFDRVFEWIREDVCDVLVLMWHCSLLIHLQLESRLPDEYQVISQVASILPENAFPPCYPFTSIVLNINVKTRVHRDTCDRHFCLVMPMGNFQGGSLALVEPGLVLDLRQGDFAVFRSCDISHFNLDYVGHRASLILHSDQDMETWRRSQNHWGHNVYLRYIQEDGL